MSTKSYHCQRCRNHQILSKLKHHKCPFNTEEHIELCELCRLLRDRWLVNKHLDSYSKQNKDTEAEKYSQGGRLVPKCARCRIHNKLSDVKGHTGANCEYNMPDHLNQCLPCRLVGKRRNIMSKTIQMRRSQQITKSTSSNADTAEEKSTLERSQSEGNIEEASSSAFQTQCNNVLTVTHYRSNPRSLIFSPISALHKPDDLSFDKTDFIYRWKC